jgi:capsular exopolysaccharide synthesis family protein
MISNHIVTPEQAERSMGDPVLAVIPLRPPTRRLSRPGIPSLFSSGDSPSWLLSQPASPFSESIRSLRSSILLSRAARPPRRILFTSPLVGDGKTTVAFNTAASLALQGNTVLLLEADMRQPKLAGLLDITAEIGLAQYLSSSRTLEEVVIPYAPIQNLFVLPGGTTPAMPAELLGSRRFGALLDRLSADYDMVLIDSPPLLLVGDALTLSSLSDATFVVLRYNRTTEEMLRRVTAKLRAVSVRNLALILNGVSSLSSEAGSYYTKSRKNAYSNEI